MSLYLGCPMWGLKTWVGNFFPAGTKPKEFLAQYSQRLNTVEGNTTFYALPDAATVERWRAETPPGFKFCLKFPQAISHHKRLKNCETETREFLDRLARLGERCGPSFLQLPPTFNATALPALWAYLDSLPRDFKYVVEPRQADFFNEAEIEFEAGLSQRDIARGIFDTTALFSLPINYNTEVREAQSRKPKFPLRTRRTAPFAFVRFVGQPEVTTNESWLKTWAERLAQWLTTGDDVFFFCHNPNDTHAPEMVRLLHSLVSKHYPLPPLLAWQTDPPPEPTQISLF